jgi:hypothetical protein
MECKAQFPFRLSDRRGPRVVMIFSEGGLGSAINSILDKLILNCESSHHISEISGMIFLNLIYYHR